MIKNGKYKEHLSDAELMQRFKDGVRLAIERAHAMGFDTVHYDQEKECIYACTHLTASTK